MFWSSLSLREALAIPGRWREKPCLPIRSYRQVCGHWQKADTGLLVILLSFTPIGASDSWDHWWRSDALLMPSLQITWKSATTSLTFIPWLSRWFWSSNPSYTEFLPDEILWVPSERDRYISVINTTLPQTLNTTKYSSFLVQVISWVVSIL